MTQYKTHSVKQAEITEKWWLVDAKGQTLGRVASKIAYILRGKHRPTFSPHLDLGDHVIVINAEQVRVSGNKELQKNYYRHSRYPGGLKTVSYQAMMEKHPTRVIEKAVHGMLPHNRLGDDLRRKLKVYAGPDHPHQAQQPTPITFEDTQAPESAIK